MFNIENAMIYGNVLKVGHYNNSLFEEVDKTHKFNSLEFDSQLRNAFFANGIEINTIDLNCNNKISFEIHLGTHNDPSDTPNKYLIQLENPFFEFRDKEYYKQFNLIFSWDSQSFSWHKGYKKILVPHKLQTDSSFANSFLDRKIFLSLINANKSFKYHTKGDLYIERLKLIQWFNRKHPNLFSLYGVGWNKPYPGITLIERQIRNFKSLFYKIFNKQPFPNVYKGEVVDKSVIYGKCKYAICYENSEGLTDYITEKIFDAMVSGCVPVYRGAPNIDDYISPNCYINAAEFKSHDALLSYLMHVTESEFNSYQENILKFLNSDVRNKFSSYYISNFIANEIKSDLIV